jgi:hypothetical protein
MLEGEMEAPGATYLYALATLAMTFVGFCAIVIVLRQTIGKELSGFHVLLTRLYIEAGFATTAFCMLPPLLAWSGVPLPAVWRASSATIVLVMLLYGWAYPRRRRVKTPDRLPLRRWLTIAIGSVVVTLGLLANIAGFPYEPGVGPIAIAATWTLGCGAVIFVLAIDAFWELPSDRQ